MGSSLTSAAAAPREAATHDRVLRRGNRVVVVVAVEHEEDRAVVDPAANRARVADEPGRRSRSRSRSRRRRGRGVVRRLAFTSPRFRRALGVVVVVVVARVVRDVGVLLLGRFPRLAPRPLLLLLLLLLRRRFRLLLRVFSRALARVASSVPAGVREQRPHAHGVVHVALRLRVHGVARPFPFPFPFQ
eukprot:30306-Pelagococcus_subviridis.AAC.12